MTDESDIVREPHPAQPSAPGPAGNGHSLRAHAEPPDFVREEAVDEFVARPPRGFDTTVDMPPLSQPIAANPRPDPGRRVLGLGDRTSTASELVAEHISAWFGSNNVLSGVSLQMRAQSVTALIGPSGCGKSTFLRILNRMHELVPGAALAGRVLLDGNDIYGPGQRPTDTRRRIGMVFQKPNPFPAMSIYDNVLAGPKLTRTPIPDRDGLVEESLQRAGLWNEVRTRLKEPGGALSGGQQQRLCIARALAIRPQVLLMDEPCSALDPTSTRRIEETIDEISYDVTIVIVTHNMQQAQRVSERCAFFLAGENEPGRIVEEGPTEKIFSTPSQPETADYVMGRFG
jgi:phosphate transport system ATP-binding protein